MKKNRTHGFVIRIDDPDSLFYRNHTYTGYIIRMGRSLDRGHITPLCIPYIKEVQKHFFERFYGNKKLAQKKYLFRTERSAKKWFENNNERIGVIGPRVKYSIHEIKILGIEIK